MNLVTTGGIFTSFKFGDLDVKCFISIAQIIYLLYGEDEERCVNLYTTNYCGLTVRLSDNDLKCDIKSATDSGELRTRTFRMSNRNKVVKLFENVLDEVNKLDLNEKLNYEELEFFKRKKE